MTALQNEFAILIETGNKKVFANAIDWPGWCRSGRDEKSAILALVDVGPRYAAVLQSTELAFIPPDSPTAFNVTEQREGNSTTDFGAPAITFSSDRELVSEADLSRYKILLEASWSAFDQTYRAVEGVELRKGPRGGGRDQQKMLEHIIMADESYIAKLGWKLGKGERETVSSKLAGIRQGILDGLEAAVRGEISEKGPRGGLRWTPRFFVRRVVWHILDHTWEITDRMQG